MKTQKHTYKPLPENFEIKPSPIHGQGLFYTGDGLDKDHFIGITHIHSSLIPQDNFDFAIPTEQGFSFLKKQKDEVFPNGLIRTPLGGFINHSEEPNIEMKYIGHGIWGIIASKEIKTGDEIVADYKFTPCGVISE